MKHTRKKYIHICGKGGVEFALWLQKKLGGDDKCALVDCSMSCSLLRYGWKRRIKSKIYQAEKWVTCFCEYEKVIFYHEQEESFTDSYPGVYFFFITKRNDFGYVNTLLTKMTGGKLCLIDKILVPQLQCGLRIYVLSLNGDNVRGEHYIQRFVYNDEVELDKVFYEIYREASITRGKRRKETNF